jgi:hypothetical protein
MNLSVSVSFMLPLMVAMPACRYAGLKYALVLSYLRGKIIPTGWGRLEAINRKI